MNLFGGSDSSVSESHPGLEIRSNGVFSEEYDSMSVGPELHPKNRVTAYLVAVDVGVDQL